jgi:hypothetical protein
MKSSTWQKPTYFDERNAEFQGYWAPENRKGDSLRHGQALKTLQEVMMDLVNR